MKLIEKKLLNIFMIFLVSQILGLIMNSGIWLLPTELLCVPLSFANIFELRLFELLCFYLRLLCCLLPASLVLLESPMYFILRDCPFWFEFGPVFRAYSCDESYWICSFIGSRACGIAICYLLLIIFFFLLDFVVFSRWYMPDVFFPVFGLFIPSCTIF